MENINQNLTLPVRIPYEVLQKLTDKTLIGMKIGTGERKQDEILGTSLGASLLPEYDVVLGLKMRILRKFLGTKEVEVFIQVSLSYDPDLGEISVDTFKIASKSKSFLLDKTLQILANRIYYRKILDKAAYNLKELIGPHVGRLNDRMGPGMPISEGMVLYGKMEDISITGITPRVDHVLVHALFTGAVELNIQKIPDIDFSS